jgi:hypothetical protein
MVDWDTFDGETVCEGCYTGEERRLIVDDYTWGLDDPVQMERLAVAALRHGDVSYSLLAHDQAADLDLPEQSGGWGLVLFDSEDGAVTAACERAFVAALAERGDHIAAWGERIQLWGFGHPPDVTFWVPPKGSEQ